MSAKRQDQEEATREKTKEQVERGEWKKNDAEAVGTAGGACLRPCCQQAAHDGS